MPILGIIASSYLQANTDFFSIASANGDGSSTTILLQNIPQGYKDLQIRYWVKSAWNPGTIADVVQIRVNEDTTANFHRHESIYGPAGTSPAYSASSFSYWGDNAFMAASSNPANVGGVGVIDIYNYSSTSMKKTGKFMTGVPSAGYYTGNYFSTGFGSISYNSNSAITSLRFTCNGAFSSDTYFALYGIRG